MMHINFDEFTLSVNINEERVLELVEYGIVIPASGEHAQEWLFNVDAVSTAKKALRLHRDLAIDWADIALVLNLLDEMEELRSENEMLKQRLNRFLLKE